MNQLDAISQRIKDTLPPSLLNSRRWVCYRLEERNGRVNKPPESPNSGEKIGCNNPASWATFDQAVAYCESHHLAGIGIMLNNDGLCAIDIDDCIDSAGNMTSYARRIIDRFATYTEISISGRGVHILCQCDPGLSINCNLRKLPHGNKLEMSSCNKYLTISGNCIHPMDDDRNCTSDFVMLYEHQKAMNDGDTAGMGVKKANTFRTKKSMLEIPPVRLTEDDLRVLDMIYRSRDDKIKQLLDEPTTMNASEADYRLCLRLMYWCHQDVDQIDRIFRHSVRMRDKWYQTYSDGSTYGSRTIQKAKDNYVQY